MTAGALARTARPSHRRAWLALLRREAGLALAAALLAAMVAAAVLAPWITPYDPFAQDLTRRLVEPVWSTGGSWDHPLGTDALGRDYLSRLLYGGRISLLVGLATALISGAIGTGLGLLGGYFGGRVDLLVNLIITTRLALPVIVVALAVVASFGGSLQTVVLTLGLLLWDRFAVVARTAVLRVRTQDYVTAAQAAGCSTLRIILREVIPNIAGPLIVVATLEVAHAVLLEAALSFLGLGVQPPMSSWGLMVAEGKEFIFFSPWLVTIPGLAIFVFVLAVNLAGDGMRDLAAVEEGPR